MKKLCVKVKSTNKRDQQKKEKENTMEKKETEESKSPAPSPPSAAAVADEHQKPPTPPAEHDAAAASVDAVTPTDIEQSLEKLDELTSLEREIAELHHVAPATPAVAQRVNDVSEVAGGESLERDKVLHDLESPLRHATASDETTQPRGNGAEADDAAGNGLEHDDLIAVLKGIDPEDEKPPATTAEPPKTTSDGESVEGVTIEGEGQFAFMDIVDDDCEGEESAAKDEHKASAVAAAGAKPHQQKKLTREEERAMAMQQMEVLKSRTQRDRHKRRKADPKAAAAGEGKDLVSNLGADWSDADEGEPQAPTQTATKKVVVKTKGGTTISTVKAAPRAGGVVPKAAPGVAELVLKPRRSTPEITNVIVLQSAKGAVTAGQRPSSAGGDSGAATNESPPTSGFKRTRIIKRKIIWDPDAPETQISYSQLVRNTAKPTGGGGSGTAPAVVATRIGSTTITPTSAAATSPKKPRPATPKEKKPAADADGARIARVITTTAKAVAPSTAGAATGPVKRRAQTPVTNGATGAATAAGKRKKISEVDRLMGDEGAVNMLNALEHERNRGTAETTAGEPPHKPMMRSRAATVSEKVVKREAPTTPPAAKTRRTLKSKASNSWDFVYQKKQQQQVNEDAMIIRRRSNSSYSSGTSLHRLSLDGPGSSAGGPSGGTTPKKSSSANSTPAKATPETSGGAVKSAPAPGAAKPAVGKTFEFAKPESKSNQGRANRRSKSPTTDAANPLTSDMKKASTAAAATKRARAVVAGAEGGDKEKTAVAPAPVGRVAVGPAAGAVSDVVVKKAAKVAQIVFNTKKAKIDYTFTAGMLNKLVDVLIKLGEEPQINVVVFVTNSPNFCHGIDFTELASGTPEKRRGAAEQLAKAAKLYLKTLATFPKPLIAAVHGNNVGLGVTQLLLFDMVVASDKSTFETHYTKIGQIPEGYCIWSRSPKIRNSFKSKLFWLCDKLHANEAALAGLVFKVAVQPKVNEEALALAKRIAAMPAASYAAMKKSSIEGSLDEVLSPLDEEFEVIKEQWVSPECSGNLAKYLVNGHL